ncbi:MAG: acyltransferase [Leptospiraceae bacterium]|nr:acyltransferase [Leptospiraceae bacterium]
MNRRATDLLRIIAVCCIVFNHTVWRLYSQIGTAAQTDFAFWLGVFNQAGKASVLFFLFLSGLAFGGHPMNADFRARDFYRNRVLRILPPYLLACLLAYGLNLYKAGQSFAGLMHFDGLTFAAGLLTGAFMPHLYFVALLVYLYIVFPVLRRISFSPRRAVLLAVPWLSVYCLALTVRSGPVLCINQLIDVLENLFGEAGGTIQYSHAILHRFLESSAILRGWCNSFWPHTFLWLHYFTFGLCFFQYGIWAGHRTLRARAESGSGLAEKSSNSSFSVRALILLVLIPISTIGIWLDFYSASQAGISADHAGRIWRLSVAVNALIWIGWLLHFPIVGHGSKALRVLTRVSFSVYLFHMFILEASYGLGMSVRIPVVMISAWVLALILYGLTRLHPVFALLFGEGDHLSSARSSAS